MKRTLLSLLVTLTLTFTTIASNAGGSHGCGGGCWHGGGCFGGGWCGGHGCWGGSCWPFFSFGIGFGYPAYSYPVVYRYPVYSYAYAPVTYSQPTYAYRVVQPYSPSVSVAVAAAPTVRTVATVPNYVYARPAAPVVRPSYAPIAPAPAAVSAPLVANSSPVPTKWVLDAHPYTYTPAATTPRPVATSYVVVQ
jgi:hypothetical protein